MERFAVERRRGDVVGGGAFPSGGFWRGLVGAAGVGRKSFRPAAESGRMRRGSAVGRVSGVSARLVRWEGFQACPRGWCGWRALLFRLWRGRVRLCRSGVMVGLEARGFCRHPVGDAPSFRRGPGVTGWPMGRAAIPAWRRTRG
ncbi:hypothetical protein, partial [Acidomonas methanolica]|uniref:hypothetical protein n=1 Tax=Acidomonas methanolica TaxID=437 RepID=UPI0022325843